MSLTAIGGHGIEDCRCGLLPSCVAAESRWVGVDATAGVAQYPRADRAGGQAIHRAAGPRLAQAGARLAPCDPGEAKATPAFDLDPPIHHVIHTVGPVWEGGGFGEAETLASCYRRSLQVADGLGARSVAFPAIATGVYGYPPDQAARIAVTTLRSTPTTVALIRLVAFDERTHRLLRDALDEETTADGER